MTEESRGNLYGVCKQFLALPLEEQAEHVAEFATTIIGPSQVKRIPGLQNGFASLQKVVQHETKKLADKLTRKVVSLSSVIDTKNLGNLASKKVPKLLGQHLAEKQNVLGRALTEEEIRSAQHFFTRTQELIHAPNATALAAEAEQICKYANYYGESRVFGILKNQKPGKSIAKTVHDSISKSSFKATKKTYKHLFLPGKNRRGTKGTGWHLTRNNPELITEITKKPNKHGVFEVTWRAPGTSIDKRSTCGPDTWNRVDFIKHARQAYANIKKTTLQNNGRTKLTGIDRLGIEWEIIVERENLFDNLISAYPLYK